MYRYRALNVEQNSVYSVTISEKKKKNKKRRKGVYIHTDILVFTWNFSEMIHKKRGTAADSGNGTQKTKGQVGETSFFDTLYVYPFCSL